MRRLTLKAALLTVVVASMAACASDDERTDGKYRDNGAVPAVYYDWVSYLPPCRGLNLYQADVAVYDVYQSYDLFTVDHSGTPTCVDDAEGVQQAGVDLVYARGRCFGDICNGIWYDGQPLPE